jgi:hypothetical protein
MSVTWLMVGRAKPRKASARRIKAQAKTQAKTQAKALV